MWKTQLNKSIRELRFVLKNSPEHHGVWNFVQNSLPEIRVINQNTFFSLSEIDDTYKTNSAIHVIFGDSQDNQDEILSHGLSHNDFQSILKEKVLKGLTLERVSIIEDNSDRDIPEDIVPAFQYVEHNHDRF